MIVIKDISDFRLQHIFECGQCFRWERETDGSYTVSMLGQTVNIKEQPGKNDGRSPALPFDANSGSAVVLDATRVDIHIDSSHALDADRLRIYLDLERDYGAIKKELMARDGSPHMAAALKYGQGMRLLVQDPWEVVISFIISQNNHIGRIKKCVESLCENFGSETGVYRGRMRYTFPRPGALAALSEKDLESCRLGYRAGYVIGTARKVLADGEDQLLEAGRQDISLTLAYLLSLPGVGPKVANCITLFAFQKYDSFPIDVWVKKVMTELYGLDEKNLAAMSDFAAEKFGALGGFAQQYLFYYMKNR